MNACTDVTLQHLRTYKSNHKNAIAYRSLMYIKYKQAHFDMQAKHVCFHMRIGPSMEVYVQNQEMGFALFEQLRQSSAQQCVCVSGTGGHKETISVKQSGWGRGQFPCGSFSHSSIEDESLCVTKPFAQCIQNTHTQISKYTAHKCTRPYRQYVCI